MDAPHPASASYLSQTLDDLHKAIKVFSGLAQVSLGGCLDYKAFVHDCANCLIPVTEENKEEHSGEP